MSELWTKSSVVSWAGQDTPGAARPGSWRQMPGLLGREPHRHILENYWINFELLSTEIIPDGFLTAPNASQFQHQDCPGISYSPAGLFFPHPCVITKKRKEHKRSRNQVLKPEYKKKSYQRTNLAKFNWRFFFLRPILLAYKHFPRECWRWSRFESAQSAHNSVTRFCDNEPDIEGEILDKNEKNSSRTADKRIFVLVCC